MLQIIKRIENIVNGINKAIMVIGGVLLPGLIATGVFFRYVLEKDFFAVEEIEIYIAIWLYFIGGALASYKKWHITADLTQSMISNFKIKKMFAILSSFITVLVVFLVTYCTVDLVTYAWKMKSTSTAWKIPLVTEYAVVLYSLILMSIYAARDFYHALTRTDSSKTCIDPF